MPSEQLIREYQRLRTIIRDLFSRIIRHATREMLVSTARDFGMYRDGQLLLGEGDMDILSDRMAYDARIGGKSLIDLYVDAQGRDGLGEDELRAIALMNTAHYSMFRIVDLEPGGCLTISDRLAEVTTGQAQSLLNMIDLSLSASAIPGLLIATRLLNAGSFHMTSGVIFPFESRHQEEIVAYLRQRPGGKKSKRRLVSVGDYHLFFFRLHKRIGVPFHLDKPFDDHRWDDG